MPQIPIMERVPAVHTEPDSVPASRSRESAVSAFDSEKPAVRHGLIPFNQLDPERHRALSSAGGKASAAARRAKRERINQEKAKAIAERELLSAEIEALRLAARKLRIESETLAAQQRRK